MMTDEAWHHATSNALTVSGTTVTPEEARVMIIKELTWQLEDLCARGGPAYEALSVNITRFATELVRGTTGPGIALHPSVLEQARKRFVLTCWAHHKVIEHIPIPGMNTRWFRRIFRRDVNEHLRIEDSGGRSTVEWDARLHRVNFIFGDKLEQDVVRV